MSSTDALRDVGSPFLGRGTRVTVVSRELERQGGVVNVVGALLLIGRIRRTPVLVPAAQPEPSFTSQNFLI